MKPFILICGVPHSYTSLISNFLIDNGAFSKEIWDNPKYDLNYSRYEDKEIQKFVGKRKKFQKYDLTHYFDSLPSDKVIVAKAPLSTFFLNELQQFTNRRIKVVYVIRNPEQVILSSMEKSGKSFIFYFERIAWMHRFIVHCDYDVYPFIAKRIRKDAKKLLEFCELPVSKIDFSSVKPLKERKPTYKKYRFSNFIWKRLSRLFRVY